MNCKFIDLGIAAKDVLIVADFHVGYEEALSKEGVLIPRFQIKDVLNRLDKLLDKVKPSIVVINGDLKHEFGTISEQEWRDALRVIDLLGKYAEKIILVKGNHDTILGPIAKKRKLELVDKYQIDDILIIHGDKEIKELPKGIKTLIIGHEHPAVSVSTELRSEKYKCFLVGKYGKYDLVVMPSFNLVTEGTDVLKEKLLSPYLQGDLSNFEVFIVSGKGDVLEFGKLKDLE